MQPNVTSGCPSRYYSTIGDREGQMQHVVAASSLVPFFSFLFSLLIFLLGGRTANLREPEYSNVLTLRLCSKEKKSFGFGASYSV